MFEKENFDDALVVIDAGLDDPSLDSGTRQNLQTLREQVIAEKAGWLRHAKNIGYGALTGKADNTEGLVAALTTDLFVVGDIRDMVIEGTNWVMGEEVDEFVVILSAVGIATTAAPYGDWFPAVLKTAKKVGALSADFVRSFGSVCKIALDTKDYSKVLSFGDTLWALAKNSSPFQAMRLLRHTDDAADVARLAEFMARHPKEGAFALHSLGDDVVQGIAKGSIDGKTAMTLVDEDLLLAVARKGREGPALLARYGRWLNPHPVVGLFKGAWKGNLQKFIVKMNDWIGFDAVLACVLAVFCYMAFSIQRLWKNWKACTATV